MVYEVMHAIGRRPRLGAEQKDVAAVSVGQRAANPSVTAVAQATVARGGIHGHVGRPLVLRQGPPDKGDRVILGADVDHDDAAVA